LNNSEFSKVPVIPYKHADTDLKLTRTNCLSRAPYTLQGDALRTTFPLLLNASLPLSCLGKTGKLQAHSIGSIMVVVDRFVNLGVFLSVIT